MADDAPSTTSVPDSSINYQRIRVPRVDESTLQIPPLSEFDSLWDSNLSGNATQRSVAIRKFANVETLGEWQDEARREIRQLAANYSSQYLPNGSTEEILSRSDQVIASGHQPNLFHPGVWFKNACLSHLASRTHAFAVNLIVDSDLCTNRSCLIPKIETNGQLRFGWVTFDQHSSSEPFECAHVIDEPRFQSFPQRLAEPLRQFGSTNKPIVFKLWEHLQTVRQQMPEAPLGHWLAAARHRLEWAHGWRSLELPLSQLAASRCFATFALAIFQHIDAFQTTFNDLLADYRQVHRIRSKAHPVPSLTQYQNGSHLWLEAPFWIWSEQSSERKPLFVCVTANSIQLTDRQGILIALKQHEFQNEFCKLGEQGIFIRPRALMTTMVSRMLLSDLFIHGIGGAKYDQLTDAIAARFFGIQLPDFLTLSATRTLPVDRGAVEPGKLSDLKFQQRQIKYHPERLLHHNANATQLIQDKQRLVQQIKREGTSKLIHDAMVTINQRLQSMVSPSVEELQQQEQVVRSKLRDNEVIGCREFSFCLFDESLIDWLTKTALGAT
ncbi:MAG: hypothetical protein AAFN77_10630 [Planctomycetota bacterium]